MKKLKRVLVLPAFLWLTWLVLTNTKDPLVLVLGALLAGILTWLVGWLRPLRAYPKHPFTAIKLIMHVAIDIAKSNVAVGILVWNWPRANATPGFVQIPLRMRDPHALAGLACIITYTPGTVWADHSHKDNILTLHVLDLKDEEAWRRTVQQRYEKPLMEIFE